MEYLVRFTPARPCTDDKCIAMTTIGLAELQQDEAFLTYPYCPRHCYIIAQRPSQKDSERDSIASFVLYELGDQGKVLDIKPVLLDELAKNNIKACEADDAWKVKYQPVKGHNITCYVVWSNQDTEFYMHRKGH